MPRTDNTIQKIYVFALVLVCSTLLLLIVHRLLWSPYMRSEVWYILDVQPVLVNPAFLGLLLSVLALGDNWWSRWLDQRFPKASRQISFFSDRKTVTLAISEIAYIESNDTEVRLVTTAGQSYRNKTRIGQWEDILGEGFVRIHRSYLVNRACITDMAGDSLVAAGTTLPISRKYRHAQ